MKLKHHKTKTKNTNTNAMTGFELFLNRDDRKQISVSSIGAYPLLRGNSQLHGKSMVVERQP